MRRGSDRGAPPARRLPAAPPAPRRPPPRPAAECQVKFFSDIVATGRRRSRRLFGNRKAGPRGNEVGPRHDDGVPGMHDAINAAVDASAQPHDATGGGRAGPDERREAE